MSPAQYLVRLLEAAAPQNGFMQDAIEHGVITGQLTLTCHLWVDVKQIGRHYDDLITAYRRHQDRAIIALQPAFAYAQAA